MDFQYYENLGLKTERAPYRVYKDAPLNTLVENAILSGEGKLSKEGALTVTTGKHTGRSAKDKYIVRSASTEERIWWDNSLSEMTPETFSKLKEKVINHLNGENHLYITWHYL